MPALLVWQSFGQASINSCKAGSIASDFAALAKSF
jgi:hypothetical protein